MQLSKTTVINRQLFQQLKMSAELLSTICVLEKSLLNNYLTKLYELTIYVTSRDQSICEQDVTKPLSVLGLIFDLVIFESILAKS